MKIAITGSTGLVGKACVAYFKAAGHDVLRMTRTHESGSLFWDPTAGVLDAASLEGINAIVNLAGENIAGGRWTVEQKKRIRDSRIQSTQLLSNALAKLQTPPKILVSASAVGYYGDRGALELTEDTSPGAGFLSSVCQEWEAATRPASERGIRVVLPRFGAILSTQGGALAKMLTPFKLGLGGVIGTGDQYMSWICIDDAVRLIDFAIWDPVLAGPVNAVAPHPVTNRVFTKTLGTVLHRPTILPLPAFVARLLLGEMADELLLSSQRTVPSKLHQFGFAFDYPTLESSLGHLIH